MPLDPSVMNRIEANIGTLDYLKGTGVLSDHKRKLNTNEYYIFVGAGGTGTSAVKKIKERLIKEVDSGCLDSQTSFLCVDTDHGFLDQIIVGNEKVIKRKEILKLPFNGVESLVWPSVNTYINKWIHPDLPATIHANAAKFLQGKGAGSYRQIGRLLLSNQSAWNELNTHINRICGIITAGDHNTRIRVFYLSGIAGGTGSGTVIDLPYIIRSEITNRIPVGLRSNVNIYGYILMPSASNTNAADGNVASEDHVRGNINGYAALKEIDHFMTIRKRNERFNVNYGSFLEVSSDHNLFDFCTLVEGGGAYSIQDNPHDSACNVISDGILNIICENENDHRTLTDSFVSDENRDINIKLEGYSDLQWPRDANYIYSVMGYSSCVVPKDLLTVQVMYKVFNAMFAKFKKAGDVTDEDVDDYIEQCGLAWKTVNRKFNAYCNKIDNVRTNIQKITDDWFKDYGPYFMVNLTREAVETLNRMQDKSDEKKGQKWYSISEVYRTAKEYISSINSGLYEVYTYVIRELKQIIEDNAKILTDVHEYDDVFGSHSFSWSPVDLRPGSQAKNLIENGIFQNVYSPNNIDNLVSEFVDDLCEKKDEWVAWREDENGNINQDFSKLMIAKAIRSFIRENIEDIVDQNIEDFLVKLLTNNSNAVVTAVDGNGAEIPSDDTITAATNLFTLLSIKASPLASARTDSHAFNFDNCYKNVYITVPKSCRWLIDCLKEIAGITIFTSDAEDSISLYRLYSGVPAWALDYTEKAEEQYESNGPTAMGLHMEQNADPVNNWQRLPNLCPKNTWSVNKKRLNRELGISGEVNAVMAKAKDYGLVSTKMDPATGKPTDYYDAFISNDITALNNAVDNYLNIQDNNKVSLAEMITYLKGIKAFEVKTILFVDQVMTDPTITDGKKDDFRFALACRTIRRLLPLYDQLKATIDVLDSQQTRIDDHNKKVIDINKLTLFVSCLGEEFFKFDQTFKFWSYYLPNQKELVKLPANPALQTCPHYLAFVAFSELDNGEYADIQNEINSRDNYRFANRTDQNVINEMQDIANRKAQLKNCLIQFTSRKFPTDPAPWPKDSDFSYINTYPNYFTSLNFERDVSALNYDINAIRKFYMALITNL